MSENKHTAGPWFAGDDEDSDLFLVGPEEYPGLVTSPVVKLHDEANARLIAAAPELLEALEQIANDGLSFSGGEWMTTIEARDKARAVISKAKGAVVCDDCVGSGGILQDDGSDSMGTLVYCDSCDGTGRAKAKGEAFKPHSNDPKCGACGHFINANDDSSFCFKCGGRARRLPPQ